MTGSEQNRKDHPCPGCEATHAETFGHLWRCECGAIGYWQDGSRPVQFIEYGGLMPCLSRSQEAIARTLITLHERLMP